jgi:hypothetical protein
MKLKSLKKNIKQQLFKKSISKNLFLVVESKHISFSPDFLVNLDITTESFSKQIFNNLKSVYFSKIKFPIKVKSFISINDMITYFLSLKQTNTTSYIYLVKVYFFLLKKNINVINYIFMGKKNNFFLNYILFTLIKRKGLINIFNSVSYPFFIV